MKDNTCTLLPLLSGELCFRNFLVCRTTRRSGFCCPTWFLLISDDPSTVQFQPRCVSFISQVHMPILSWILLSMGEMIVLHTFIFSRCCYFRLLMKLCTYCKCSFRNWTAFSVACHKPCALSLNLHVYIGFWLLNEIVQCWTFHFQIFPPLMVFSGVTNLLRRKMLYSFHLTSLLVVWTHLVFWWPRNIFSGIQHPVMVVEAVYFL